MVVTRPNSNFHTKQIVYFRESTRPYVGFEGIETTPGGWRHDIKRWCSIFDLRLPNMPNLADASTQGISESEYFKSGVGSVDMGDLYIEDIDELFQNHERYWVPIIRHGHYYRYKTPFFLYGDNSRIQYIDPLDNRSGGNYIELDSEPEMVSPIMAATFIRHPTTRTPYYDIRVNQVSSFSGVFVDQVEQETVSAAGKITWSNIDVTKKEFIVDNTIEGVTALRFNRDFARAYGVVPTVFEDLAACQMLGMSNGNSYQVYYLKHFPVLADDSFHLYVVTGSTWVEWTRVSSWFDLLNSAYIGENKYFLDKDFGIVYFGSAAQGGIPSLNSFVVAAYTTTLRIEYDEADLPTTVTAWDADTNPVTQHINQGFVVITHDLLEAASIKLEINKPHIPFTNDPREYGPLYTGSDYAVLKATVKTAEGVVVPDVEVGFTMVPANVGYLAGSSASTSVTNGRGEAYTSYQPPVSTDTMGYYTTTIRASNHPSYLVGYKDIIIPVTNAGWSGQEDEIYLYQILKDDILQGYDNVDDFIYYELDAPAWVVDATTYDQWKSEVIQEYDLVDWTGVNADGSINGRKVVVYRINPTTDNTDAAAINPVTGELSAVVPVRPELVEQITTVGDPYYGYLRLVYPAGAVPNCDPDNPNFAIGGYWAVSSRVVGFRAHCWSPYYNKIIYSNTITARIALQDYLLGEYINDLLQKVPFGWKLLTDTDNVAAGIDGATFITVNPHSGPYQILDLVNSGPDDDWADAPFRTVGLQFEII